MNSRKIHTKFWQDPYVQDLTIKEKLLFLYLLANEHIGFTGIYEVSEKQISFESGIPPSDIKAIKEKFQADNKFHFFENWVRVANVDKYNDFSGTKLEVAKNKEIAMIPDRVSEYFDTLSIPYRYPIDTPNSNSNINSNSNLNTNNEEKIEIETIECRYIREFNVIMNKQYKKLPTKAVSSLKDRLKTYSLEEILTAVQNAKMDKFHIENGYKYLTPEFFTREDKIEKFLNYSGNVLFNKVVKI